jgi:hypothetical protein
MTVSLLTNKPGKLMKKTFFLSPEPSSSEQFYPSSCCPKLLNMNFKLPLIMGLTEKGGRTL